MTRLLLKLLIVSTMLANSIAFAQQTFQSAETASTIIELYSSEGCSSCPPADRWLSQFTDHPLLFSQFIPMAFHVDYWDYIGWKDPFADKRFSLRQRQHAAEGTLSAVYTPGFVVNNQEWRAWFRNRSAQLPTSHKKPGILKITLDKNHVTAVFPKKKNLKLNFAYLGLGLETEVKAGENHNRTLKHDFVVLDHWTINDEDSWKNIELKKLPQMNQQQSALVVWLSDPNKLTFIQGTGTLLKEDNIKYL